MEPLRQTGTISDYCNDFHGWFRQCQVREGFSDFVGVYLFIDGLKPEIWEIFVDWHQYSCNRVEDAISLALKIDANGLQDSFSPFDPESSFYNKELEWDTTITLDELMKDNAFFRNGMIQETVIDEVIDDKDLEKSEQRADDKDSLDISENIDSAYKVFDEMPEPIRDEIEAQFSDIYICESILSERLAQKITIHEVSDVIVEMDDSKNLFSRHFKDEVGSLSLDVLVENSFGEVMAFQFRSDIVYFDDFWGQKSLKDGVLGREMVIESFGWKPGWMTIESCGWKPGRVLVNRTMDRKFVVINTKKIWMFCFVSMFVVPAEWKPGCGSIDDQLDVETNGVKNEVKDIKEIVCLENGFVVNIIVAVGSNGDDRDVKGCLTFDDRYQVGLNNELSEKTPMCFVAADNKSGNAILGRSDYLKRDVIQMGFNGLKLGGLQELESVMSESVRFIETISVPILVVDVEGLIYGWNAKIAKLIGLNILARGGNHPVTCVPIVTLGIQSGSAEIIDVSANMMAANFSTHDTDVLNQFWVLIGGGISKASRLINSNEHIFAGFNCTLKGGNVTHYDYIQVGKGRDAGLNQVSMFEAKVASWERLYLVRSGVENPAACNANTNKALGMILNHQLIVIVENTLELFADIWEFITMQFQLPLVSCTLSSGTRSRYFGQTILLGGEKYRASNHLDKVNQTWIKWVPGCSCLTSEPNGASSHVSTSQLPAGVKVARSCPAWMGKDTTSCPGEKENENDLDEDYAELFTLFFRQNVGSGKRNTASSGVRGGVETMSSKVETQMEDHRWRTESLRLSDDDFGCGSVDIDVDNDEEEDDFDGSVGNWVKLETMHSSHSMDFANQVAEFASDVPIDYMDRPPPGLAIHGPARLEENSIINSHMFNHQFGVEDAKEMGKGSSQNVQNLEALQTSIKVDDFSREIGFLKLVTREARRTELEGLLACQSAWMDGT